MTAHLMMKRRTLHFLGSENNNFFLLSNVPASPHQERSQIILPAVYLRLILFTPELQPLVGWNTAAV